MAKRIGGLVSYSRESHRCTQPTCEGGIHHTIGARLFLRQKGLLSSERIRELTPRSVTNREFELFHSEEYITALQRVSVGNFVQTDLLYGLGTEESPISSSIELEANLITGGSLAATEMILYGCADFAFNPAGGLVHAAPERAKGTQFVNDVALVCHKIKQTDRSVLCIVLDPNYPQALIEHFYNDPKVFIASICSKDSGTGHITDIGDGTRPPVHQQVAGQHAAERRRRLACLQPKRCLQACG